MGAVRCALGAKALMSVLYPTDHLPRFSAACWAAGVSWCCAMTSAPLSRRASAASRSLGGSYQDCDQTTLTVAFGFTDRTPRAKALMPRITSGMGCAATYPMVFVFVILPATIPER